MSAAERWWRACGTTTLIFTPADVGYDLLHHTSASSLRVHPEDSTSMAQERRRALWKEDTWHR